MSHGNEFAPCKTCIFYSNYRTGGLYIGCNMDNEEFDKRQNHEECICYDHRTFEEMLEILEYDDGILRT